MEDRVKELLADVFAVEPSIISADFTPEKAEHWDSLNHLRMITALEEAFHVKFSMQEIGEMNTYPKVLHTLQKRLRER